MNQTKTVNLAGINFYLDLNAYTKLENYLSQLKNHFAHQEGANEILRDIETRIAEIFQEKISNPQEVIGMAVVKEVIAILGQPGDFDQDENQPHSKAQHTTIKKRLFRDMDNRMLGGVCSGLGAYLNLDPVLIRIIFVVAVLSGISLLLYLILWIVIPPARTTAEKIEMQGNPVNIENIEKVIRQEMNNLKNTFDDLSEQARNTFKRKN
jgi:phage shock protein PspC (stress-responsive transcriptional regulator)